MKARLIHKLMRKRTLFIASAAFGLAAGWAGAQTHAQHAEENVFEAAVPAPPPGQKFDHPAILLRGLGAPGTQAEFMSAEFGLSGKVVKGAPYSAEAVTETVQVLADGNRIAHKNSVTIARDSEGRTRRDVSLQPLIGGTEAAPRFSMIHDPVANVSYTLEHNDKVARKMQGRGFAIRMERKIAAAGSVPATQGVVVQREHVMSRSESTSQSGGTADVVVRRAPVPSRWSESGDARTEQLGKRNLEGVLAEGTRSTVVIPAGQIGNERPIEIVSERWYSPELQALVMSRHADPRSGETVYKLTNVRRGEPAKSLFEVPPDYTVKTDEPPIGQVFIERQ